MPPQGEIHGPGGIGHSGDQGQVFLVDLAGREGLGQAQTCRLGQRQNDKPGGVLVQAMHDTGALPGLGQQGRKMMGHAVHKRRLSHRRRRMHGHGRSLVDHDQVVIGE